MKLSDVRRNTIVANSFFQALAPKKKAAHPHHLSKQQMFDTDSFLPQLHASSLLTVVQVSGRMPFFRGRQCQLMTLWGSLWLTYKFKYKGIIARAFPHPTVYFFQCYTGKNKLLVGGNCNNNALIVKLVRNWYKDQTARS